MKHPSGVVINLLGPATETGENAIPITGSFSFGDMSAIFIRDPDRNVIELDAYGENKSAGEGYEQHP